MTELPPVTFALGMASVAGSPPYPVLLFDDGAAVSLHALRGLAAKLGMSLPTQSIFALLQSWNLNFHQLIELVQALAYDDVAKGHRGEFTTEDFLALEDLLPQARQVFRCEGAAHMSLPVSVLGPPNGVLHLGEHLKSGHPNFCLGAIMGQACEDIPQSEALSCIAGWTIVTEFVRTDVEGLAQRGVPRSTVLGPVMVPTAFGGQLDSIPFELTAMGGKVITGTLDQFTGLAAAAISELSHACLLQNGDVVIVGGGPDARYPELGTVDVVEAYASGFGRQQTSLI